MMREIRGSDVLAVVEGVEAALVAHCDACGADNPPGESLTCRICGEPVLSDGWVP